MKSRKLILALGGVLLLASLVSNDSYAALGGIHGLEKLKADFPSLEINVPYSGEFDWYYSTSVRLRLWQDYNYYSGIQLDFSSNHSNNETGQQEIITAREKHCTQISKEEYENQLGEYNGGYRAFYVNDNPDDAYYCGYTYTDEEVELTVNYIKVDNDGKGDEILEGLKDRYIIEDMEALNYMMSGSKMLTMYRFSGEMRNYLDSVGADIVPAGQGGGVMGPFSGGEGQAYVIVCPNGAYCNSTNHSYSMGIRVNRVIYIPEDTPDEEEATVNAIKKRIIDYLGESFEDKVEVRSTGEKYGLDSEIVGEENCQTEKMAYAVRIWGIEGKFYVEKDNSKIKNPQLSVTQSDNNTTITTDSGEVPLDSINLTEYVGEAPKEMLAIISSPHAEIWNLQLFSYNKDSYITELENGEFEVSIPISEVFKGKKLAVFYIDEDGNIEKYEVEEKDGKAIFRTKHFSEYILAIDEEDTQNPKTSDSALWLLVPVSLITLIGCVLPLANRR